ncbi:DUF4129 domain-containing protein [Pseudonocardia sp. MH-G8]|uniref:DUF4129 domain-containing protein n=1 Tax=Pseudonocardia sp. MH-G8 TaxID=1854588 RepID=UPI000BA056EC|nr:DUF4129 domain-containing protein [Pseudonocardia sp. MH-G8]OZM76508.1 hypothetical protein CFP66_41005 [Pseudonocardia sp. MH-G8]
MTSRRTVALGALLGLVVVVAAGSQGTATFTGLRWSLDRTAGPAAMPARPPVPSQPLPSRVPATPGAGGSFDLSRILLWVAVGAVVLLVAVLVWRRLARRSPRSTSGVPATGPLLPPPPEPEPEPEPVPEPEPEPPVLRRGVEEALRLLDEEREPGDAVLKAWLGLQQTAEDSGIVRGSAETPTEFTARIMRRVFADDRAIRSLLALYLRVRFGDHPVSAADVAQAREALAGLARTWDDGAARRPAS